MTSRAGAITMGATGKDATRVTPADAKGFEAFLGEYPDLVVGDAVS